MYISLFQLYYELIIKLKDISYYINTTFFYITIIIIFPISINFRLNILSTITIPIICVCSFIIILLTLEHIFLYTKMNGYLLEYPFIQHLPIYIIIIFKLIVQWFITSICIIIGTFVAYITYNIEILLYLIIIKTILFIIPILLLIGAMGSALLIGYRDKNILLSFIVIPFYMPVLILTLSYINNSVNNIIDIKEIYTYLLFLILLTVISPILSKNALQMWNE